MYLRPAMKQAGSRLTVSTNTLVHRVLFNGRRAVGIEYNTGGKDKPIQRSYAKREVGMQGRRHRSSWRRHCNQTLSELLIIISVGQNRSAGGVSPHFRNRMAAPLLVWYLTRSPD